MSNIIPFPAPRSFERRIFSALQGHVHAPGEDADKAARKLANLIVQRIDALCAGGVSC